MEFLQLQFAADFRVAISASFCSSLFSRFRGFPDMVSVRDERPARGEDAHEFPMDHEASTCREDSFQPLE